MKKKKDLPSFDHLVSAINTFVAGFVLFAVANYETLLQVDTLEKGAFIAFLLAGVRAGVKPLMTLCAKWASSILGIK